MIYNKDEILLVLEEANIIIKLEEGYSINATFGKKMTNRSENFCLNFPTSMMGASDILIYNKVMEACKIPLMHTGEFSYFLRTQTKDSVKALKELLKDPNIDYNKFILKTKEFYNSSIAAPGFGNYLTKKTWQTVYADETKEEKHKLDMKGLF